MIIEEMSYLIILLLLRCKKNTSLHNLTISRYAQNPSFAMPSSKHIFYVSSWLILGLRYKSFHFIIIMAVHTTDLTFSLNLYIWKLIIFDASNVNVCYNKMYIKAHFITCSYEFIFFLLVAYLT